MEESFNYVVPIDLEHIFDRKYKLIPSIDSTSNEEAWFKAGMQRVVYFNDGTTSHEELLSVTPSSGFTYKVSKFTSSLRLLIKEINGRWFFLESKEGDLHITWTYEFVPKNFLTRFIVRNVVAKQIKVPMQRALGIMKEELESGNLYRYKRRVGQW